VNVEELQRLLESEKVDPQSYRINTVPAESTMCIKKQGKTWLVFFFERGIKRELQRFSTETAACDYFLRQIKGGP
jgi:hypothetical protein